MVKSEMFINTIVNQKVEHGPYKSEIAINFTLIKLTKKHQ